MPRVSSHALRRWNERSVTPGVWNGDAWARAIVVDENAIECVTADEVRYHPPSETVLLRKAQNIVTVIHVETMDAVDRCRVRNAARGETV
jgi:ribulose 1,5-bisphosphate synthetase/thiazole synthase